MKRNIQIDEFEKFLREKSDQYKLYPSDKIWNNINRSVHSGRKWPYIILTLFVFLGSAVFVDYKTFNYVIPGKKAISTFNTIIPASEPIQIVEKTTFDRKSTEPENANNSKELTATTTQTPTNKSLVIQKQAIVTNDQATDQAAAANNETYADYSDINTPADITKNTLLINHPVKKNNVTEENNDEENKKKKVLWAGEAFKKSKFNLQISFSPTISYRRLTSGLNQITEVFRGVPYNKTEQSTAVNKLVNHKPAIGAEAGANVIYKLTNNFTLRAGLQVNYSRYQLSAFNSKPEQTTIALQGNYGMVDSLNLISPYKNYSGAGASWLNNEYLQLSMPIGFEWSVLGNKSPLKWNIGASVQPVYNFSNNVYLLSTDFEHYVQDPSLIRKWNINAGVETFVSYDMGSFKWQVGPQFRYQLNSSYKSQYPIKEYVVDFGFKVGLIKTIR